MFISPETTEESRAERKAGAGIMKRRRAANRRAANKSCASKMLSQDFYDS